MDIRDYSSQFSIYVFTSNVDVGATAKVQLSQLGYDAFYFQDPEALENALKESPPHILIFSTESLGGALNDFINLVLDINDEIKFIVLASEEQFSVLSQYNEHGLVDVLPTQGPALDQRIAFSVDRACERLYFNFQNEQLFDDLNQRDLAESDLNKIIQKLELEKAQFSKQLNDRDSMVLKINSYRNSQSKEALIQNFLNQLGPSLCIYFKFLPSVRSFVAICANGISSDRIQGVGVQLLSEESKSLDPQLAVGILPLTFSTMLSEAFKFTPAKVLPLYVGNVLEGLFVYSGQLRDVEAAQINEEFALFSLSYSHFCLEKKVDALEVTDFATDLFNRNYYFKALFDEVSRSRRQKMPVSVVKLMMDDYFEIESSLGDAVRDELFKSVATITQKSSRSNDLTCRTASNEISMILPNCNKKGAALRAERLRRIIEATSFLDNGVKVTVSLGISEYPTLCNGDKELDETSYKALTHIHDKGGNKICLFRAPDNFVPEFEVSPE